MARIRTIKPEFWKSESIAALPIRTRLTFIGLWSYVDDNGVGLDNKKLIVAELFPLEDDPLETLANVSRDLQTLSEAGRITRYTVSGKRFLAIVGWSEHQKIDKPGKPRYPTPDIGGDTPKPSCDAGSEVSDISIRESVANPRESVATPSRLEQGTGNREQGTGKRYTAPVGADGRFLEFWRMFPKRVARKDAEKAWRKIDPGDHDAIFAGLRSAVGSPDWAKDAGKFIPYPATWLNGRRWEDEQAAGPLSGNPDGELPDGRVAVDGVAYDASVGWTVLASKRERTAA